MIRAVRDLHRKLVANESRKELLKSLLFNFIAKLPGLLAVFIVLPIISKALGSENYGQLLAAIGLGTSLCLPLAGLKTVGRRQLAKAYGADNQKAQADIFITLTLTTLALTIIIMVVTGILTLNSWTTPLFLIITMMPLIAGFLDTFDSVRASFNQHYITAKLQLYSQLVIYGLVIFIGIPKGAIILSGLIMNPFAIASLGTIILLLLEKRYLLSGRVKDLLPLFRSSLAVTLSGGILSSLLGLVIFWYSQTISADFAAWVGTFARLFMTFIAPLMLVLFPLTSFISIHWERLSIKRKSQLHTGFTLFSLAFGIFIAVLIGFAAPIYIDYMFDLPVTGDKYDIISLSIFMGAIIAQKTYSMFIYSFCEGLFISYASIAVLLVGVAVAATASIWLPLTELVNVMFVTIGTVLPLMLIYENFRQQKILKQDSA